MLCMSLYICMFSFSVVYNFFATPWAVAHQAPQLWEIPASILDWVAIFFSGDLPNPGMNPHLLHFRQILYHWATREAPFLCLPPCYYLFFFCLKNLLNISLFKHLLKLKLLRSKPLNRIFLKMFSLHL